MLENKFRFLLESTCRLQLFTNEAYYYETELFAKFEDAFLHETGAKGSGIAVVHGQRSVVKSLSTDKICELGDVRMIIYQPSTIKMRQIYIQFKRQDETIIIPGTRIVKISEKQYDLYKTHPEVRATRKGVYIDSKVLQDNTGRVMEDAGTMFCAIYKDGKNTCLAFSNCNGMLLTKTYSRKNYVLWEIDSMFHTIMNKGGSYAYYESLGSFKDFLNGIKEMNIGMEVEYIPIIDIPAYIIPTIYINVDELTD